MSSAITAVVFCTLFRGPYLVEPTKQPCKGSYCSAIKVGVYIQNIGLAGCAFSL